MHPKFVDVWCRNFDDAWGEKGKQEAINLLNKNLTLEQRLLVKKRLPDFLREKKEELNEG